MGDGSLMVCSVATIDVYRRCPGGVTISALGGAITLDMTGLGPLDPVHHHTLRGCMILQVPEGCNASGPGFFYQAPVDLQTRIRIRQPDFISFGNNGNDTWNPVWIEDTNSLSKVTQDVEAVHDRIDETRQAMGKLKDSLPELYGNSLRNFWLSIVGMGLACTVVAILAMIALKAFMVKWKGRVAGTGL